MFAIKLCFLFLTIVILYSRLFLEFSIVQDSIFKIVSRVVIVSFKVEICCSVTCEDF